MIESSEQQGKQGHRHPWPRQVLLVDDVPLVRQAIGETLRSIGIFVVDVSSPVEALRLCAGLPDSLDLLIVDIEMPEMSGWALASQIASRMDNIQVLYISGGVDVVQWRLHPDRVVDSYFLAKPFTFDCLAGTLDVIAKSRNLKTRHETHELAK